MDKWDRPPFNYLLSLGILAALAVGFDKTVTAAHSTIGGGVIPVKISSIVHIIIAGLIFMVAALLLDRRKRIQLERERERRSFIPLLTNKRKKDLFAQLKKNSFIEGKPNNFDRYLHDDIIYFYAKDREVYIVFTLDRKNKKEVAIRGNLEQVYKALPKEIFFRCHRAYIVNTKYVIKARRDSSKNRCFIYLKCGDIDGRISLAQGRL